MWFEAHVCGWIRDGVRQIGGSAVVVIAAILAVITGGIRRTGCGE
jgi:hypothetical protein